MTTFLFGLLFVLLSATSLITLMLGFSFLSALGFRLFSGRHSNYSWEENVAYLLAGISFVILGIIAGLFTGALIAC